MKHTGFRLLQTALIGSLALLSQGFCEEMKDTTHAGTLERCSKAHLLSHFPATYVRETLEARGFPKDKIDDIVADLQSKEGEVIRRVEESAKERGENVLKDPAQRQLAMDIFREAMREVIAEVLAAHGIQNKEEAAKLLKDLQQRKAQAFSKCIENEGNSSQ
jgi:hypothetical protein